jgi:hypothetical protein
MRKEAKNMNFISFGSKAGKYEVNKKLIKRNKAKKINKFIFTFARCDKFDSKKNK